MEKALAERPGAATRLPSFAAAASAALMPAGKSFSSRGEAEPRGRGRRGEGGAAGFRGGEVASPRAGGLAGRGVK